MTGAVGHTPEYLAFGDLGVDSVARLDHLPRADEKLWVEPAGDYPGGMMGNATATVASLGVSAGVVGLLGEDARGAFVLEALQRRGVDTRMVRSIDAATFWTLSLTTSTGERTLIQFPTPAFGADWERFDHGWLRQARWVHTAAEQGAPVAALLAEAQASGARTSLDIEFPFVLRDDLHELLAHTDVAFLNAAAADALGGVEEAAGSAQAGGAVTVVVTLGERGAFLLDRSQAATVVPAHEVVPVDTNGAGDALAGAYAAAVLKGLTERDAVQLGVLVAGLSTTVMGGHGANIGLSALRGLAKEHAYAWWERL